MLIDTVSELIDEVLTKQEYTKPEKSVSKMLIFREKKREEKRREREREKKEKEISPTITMIEHEAFFTVLL